MSSDGLFELELELIQIPHDKMVGVKGGVRLGGFEWALRPRGASGGWGEGGGWADGQGG